MQHELGSEEVIYELEAVSEMQTKLWVASSINEQPFEEGTNRASEWIYI